MTHGTPPRESYIRDGRVWINAPVEHIRASTAPSSRRRVTLSGRSYSMGPMAFRVLIIGGTGQVGAAVVRALAAEPSCVEVVMVNRRAISLAADPRVRQVTMDTAADHFVADVTTLAHGMVAQRDPVYGASCVGVGKGGLNWSEEDLKALELGVVGGFARGCHAGASSALLSSPQ